MTLLSGANLRNGDGTGGLPEASSGSVYRWWFYPHRMTPIVYWRPGCGFCMRLMRGIEEAGLEIETRNIWEDPEAASFVRSVTGGNEIVPTVSLGDRNMVNPSIGDLLALIGELS